jgi:hypothetical protein
MVLAQSRFASVPRKDVIFVPATDRKLPPACGQYRDRESARASGAECCAAPVLIASVRLDHGVRVRYDGPVWPENRADCCNESWRVDHLENPWIGVHVIEDVVSFPRCVGVPCSAMCKAAGTMERMDPAMVVRI